MNTKEIKEEIERRTRELDFAIETKLPHAEVIAMYTELKELQYKLVQLEIQERRRTIDSHATRN